MTREINFRQSFSTQFETATGFKRISIPEIAKFAPSDFPSFALAPGDAKYTAFDAFGTPTAGEQDFVLTVFFTLPELTPETLLQYRSDYLATMELFIDSSYIPPIVLPGETYRIARTQLVKVSAPVLTKSMTRFSISAHCKYFFTML
jgi:hypothetical protein